MEEIITLEETQEKPIILWLEDDPSDTWLEILNFFFKMEQIFTADEMRKKLTTQKYDGLLLDIMLPAGAEDLYPEEGIPGYMAGMKVLEMILGGKFPKNKADIPLLVVSGVGLPEIQKKIEEIVRPHVNALYLDKPQAPEAIVEALYKAGVKRPERK